MITLKQLIEQHRSDHKKPYSYQEQLKMLTNTAIAKIKQATSEKELIDFMFVIKEKFDKLLTTIPDSLKRHDNTIFSTDKKLSGIEKQAFYSLGLSPKQLLFRMTHDVYCNTTIVDNFIYKMYQFIKIGNDFPELMYSIKVKPERPISDPMIYSFHINVYYHSIEYIIFFLNVGSNFLYVAKL
jgi:hypothetical protein